MADNKKIEQVINGYKEVVSKLESVKDGTEAEQNMMMKAASNNYCCGSCIAVSNICTPDATPNKCQGGCTAISFAF